MFNETLVEDLLWESSTHMLFLMTDGMAMYAKKKNDEVRPVFSFSFYADEKTVANEGYDILMCLADDGKPVIIEVEGFYKKCKELKSEIPVGAMKAAVRRMISPDEEWRWTA